MLTDNCKGDAGLSTGYLRVPSDTIKYGRGLREVGFETAIVLNVFWLEKEHCLMSSPSAGSDDAAEAI